MNRLVRVIVLITLLAGAFLTMSPQVSQAQDCEPWFFTFRNQFQYNQCADEVSVTKAQGADFEGGRAYWYAASPNFGADLIYVIYNDHTWSVYPATQGSSPQSVTAPANRYVPQGPVGVLWNNNPQVRQKLGWAYEPVKEFVGRRQLPIMPVGNRFNFYIDHGKSDIVLRLTQDFITGEQTWVVAGEYSRPTPPTVPPVYANTAIGTLTPNYAYEINVRTGAGLNYEILGIIDWRETVPLISVGNQWHQIEYNGQVAYVTARYTQYELYPEPVPDYNFIDGMAFAMLETDNFASMGVDVSTHESIALIGDRSGYGIQNMSGGVWITPNGNAFIMYVDSRGFPSIIQYGGDTYIFENYQGTNVDVAVLRSDQSIVIFDNVPLDASFYVEVANLIANYTTDTRFTRTALNTQVSALNGFKLFGWGVQGVACEVASYGLVQIADLAIANLTPSCQGFITKINNFSWTQPQAELLDDGWQLMRTQDCLASILEAKTGDATTAVQQSFARECMTTVAGASDKLLEQVRAEHEERAAQIANLRYSLQNYYQ